MAKHKVIIRHEPTGRDMIFVNSYTHHIDGMSVEDGKCLITELMDHMAQDKYKLRVEWESPGDLVIWDNTSVLHRADKNGSFVGKHRRDMRRISVFDTSIHEYGLNEKQKVWQADTT